MKLQPAQQINKDRKYKTKHQVKKVTGKSFKEILEKELAKWAKR